MIIFFDKATGEITGRINGRIHPEEHLKMYQGDPQTTGRIVLNWKATKFFDKNGAEIPKEEVAENPKLVFSADFEPDHYDARQRAIHEKLDRNGNALAKLKVDPATEFLVLKSPDELYHDQEVIQQNAIKIQVDAAERHARHKEYIKTVMNKKTAIKDRFEALLQLLAEGGNLGLERAIQNVDL